MPLSSTEEQAFHQKLQFRFLIVLGILCTLGMGLYIYTGLIATLAFPLLGIAAYWLFTDIKSFYWLFILSIPFSVQIYLAGGSLSTSLPDEPIMWVFVGVTGLLWAHNKNLLPKWYVNHPLFVIILLQFIWLVVSVIYSTDHFYSVKFLLAKIWFLNAFIIFPAWVISKPKDLKRMVALFVIPVVLHSFVVIVWHYFEDFGFQASNKVVKPFYYNHVDYSTILSCVFPILIGAFLYKKDQKLRRWVLLGLILFMLPAIYFASARAAILGVVFALVVWAGLKYKFTKWLMPIGFVAITFIMSLMIHNENYLSLRPDKHENATQETFIDAVTGMFSGKDMSSMERIYRWIASVRMAPEKPIVGVGPNNFYDHYKNYTVTSFETWVSENPERSTTHNYFLFLLVEQGFPAMILYAVFLIVFFARCQKLYHLTKRRDYQIYVMVITMVMAANFVNNFFSELIETHKVGAVFYLSIASLIIVDRWIKQEIEGEKVKDEEILLEVK